MAVTACESPRVRRLPFRVATRVIRALSGPDLVSVVAFAVIPVVGLIDAGTGPYLSFSAFYLAPAALIAWRSGVGPGVAAVLAVAAISLAADLAPTPGLLLGQGDSQLERLMPWWNVLVRAAAAALVVALAVHQRRVLDREVQLARTDALTGLANRRHFLDVLAAEIHRSRRYRRPLTVVLVDVDKFKMINDEHGHAAGDDVLRGVAESLVGRGRETDLVARLGGDEFALLLLETDMAGAERVLESLDHPLLIQTGQGHEHSVRLSAGAASVAGGDVEIDAVLAEADRGLYASKRAARRVR